VDSQDGRVLKCDLCDGDPTCAKVCPTEAITCEEISKESYLKLIANADCIPQLVKQALGS
jgi:Fe-S-cluster-containing hydrogenase component 2